MYYTSCSSRGETSFHFIFTLCLCGVLRSLRLVCLFVCLFDLIFFFFWLVSVLGLGGVFFSDFSPWDRRHGFGWVGFLRYL